ncbi:MAG: glutamine-hydrolyzing GMP synthase [Chlamydiales bacterium]
MILIVDFGSQTTHQIGRRLKQIGIASFIVKPDAVMETAQTHGIKGIILSGGPASVNDKGAPHIDPAVFNLSLPILGICYGWQLMAYLLGGKVEQKIAEYGPQTLFFQEDVFELKKNPTSVIMSHSDTVVSLPKHFSSFASTSQIPYAAVVDKGKQFWGIQFHPEVEHTEKGLHILKYFASHVCKAREEKYSFDIEELIHEIRKKVADNEVICAVSGGVDSTVAAYLIKRAIGKKLRPIYIDNGLMRVGTRKRVENIFRESNLTVIEAESIFLEALKGIEDPEIKRKIIGKLYVNLFEKEARKFPSATYLAQGTIYSDVVESSQIKSHHNVGGLPKKISFELLEPLRFFYKDEVRSLGYKLGLPSQFIEEHPFPGPGYAVRVRGEVTAKRLTQVKQADTIVMEMIEQAGLKQQLFQCFAVMTGAYSTAVKGDARAFSEVVALRAYESTDVMTSQVAQLPYPLLQQISNRIVNEVPNISRVVYDLTPKPPATMEWE